MTKPTATNTTAPNIFSNDISPSCLFIPKSIDSFRDREGFQNYLKPFLGKNKHPSSEIRNYK